MGSRELWTQEHRWADVVLGMFYRKDFLHPYLGSVPYYDKPLLSYWLMALLAQFFGTLTTWALRLPSAFSALLAIWSIYRLGTLLRHSTLGLLSGWMLLTTFYFLFWGRTSSADMLNLAGSLFAVTWYFEKKHTPTLSNYTIFFLIIALTALCKGLVGVIVPCLVIFIDLCLTRSFKQYLSWTLLFACLPACVIYVLPFWASSHFHDSLYAQNGLYLVYRENLLRYFQPFDHQGPFYTYFIYLPIYLLPWAVFFIPAILTLPWRWTKLTLSSKWMALTVLTLFLFFTLSGSRRSYYILPVVPFALLFTADWLIHTCPSSLHRWFPRLALCFFIVFLLAIDVIPAWYYSKFGINQFTTSLKEKAIQKRPWPYWNVVLLDAESKITFYLKLPPDTPQYGIGSLDRKKHTQASLIKAWPLLTKPKPAHTIFITRELYRPLIQSFFPGYTLLEVNASQRNEDSPVAFLVIG